MIERKKIKKNILPQMFDIKPVDENGDLDFRKIGIVRKVSRITDAKLELKLKKTDAIKLSPIIPVNSGKVISEIVSRDNSEELYKLRKQKEFFIKEKEKIFPKDNLAKMNSEEARIFEKENEIKTEILRPLKNYELSAIPEPSLIDILQEERKRKEFYLKRTKSDIRNRKIVSFTESVKNISRSILFFPANVFFIVAKSFFNGTTLAIKKTGEIFLALITFPFKVVYYVIFFSVSAAQIIARYFVFSVKCFSSFLIVLTLTFVDILYAVIIFPFQFLFQIYNKTAKSLQAKSRNFTNAFEGFEDSLGNSFIYPRANKNRLPMFSFLAVSTCIFFAVFGVGLFYRGIKIKDIATQNGQVAYASLMEAKDEIVSKDFTEASLKFGEAYDEFDKISKEVDGLGSIFVESSRFLPFASKLSSGSHLVEAGKDISKIGILSSELLETFNEVKNPLENKNSVSFLEIFKKSDEKVGEISELFLDLENHINKIDLNDIPEEQRSKFIEIKKRLPEINKFLSGFIDQEKIFVDILGGNGPRKYLFLFQNNQEMRATGGFIGTYGILDIFDGRVKRFLIDGIFNPDGQLKEKVVPPAPIQKISVAWSLHDSNWFPDFPKSAEKAAWFFEKTGGPTVDGIITMTPTVMQKMLEITGPIEMKEYDVTVDKDNFIENIQQEVEENYDRDINQPKKILADLAPIMLDRLFNAKNVNDIAKAMSVIGESLNEKHILIYSKNYELEKIISANGWSGEILGTQKDYLSVINTNINGFKTDGVVEENIVHKAEIQDDGSIIDSVSITRKHNGGKTNYDWWNRVNANYMRVYVPQGSKLLSVSGQTREFNSPPIDYDALGFKRDSQVAMEENATEFDEETGTRIYEDSNKTVFGNWVYVSPQETVTITYTYLLPFKINIDSKDKLVDTYSLLLQKQSGSIGSNINSMVSFPKSYDIVWKYPDESVKDFSDITEGKNSIEIEDKLESDKFIGIAFQRN